MITNQRQYALAKAEASRFEDALAKEKAKGPRKGVHPRIHQAKLHGLQSQLDELNAEVNEFEALSSPDTPCEFTVTSVLDLSTVLIQARIAAGWTQKQLAEALGLTEQQIQRYEATRYEGISLKRANDIAKMLNVSFQGVGQYDKSKRAS
jgi:DNA-binding XRE family transcriptional regulator